jgi:hypothetical protein
LTLGQLANAIQDSAAIIDAARLRSDIGKVPGRDPAQDTSIAHAWKKMVDMTV